MSDQNIEDFKNLVASDSASRDRWLVVRDQARVAADQIGVIIDSDDDLLNLPSVRLAVLASHYDMDQMLTELKSVETVRAQLHQQELKSAIENGQESAIEEINRLSPAERISKARQLNLDTNPPTKADAAPTSVAEEATLIRQLMSLNPASRISRARSLGLLK